MGFGYIITTNNNHNTIEEYSGKLPEYCSVYQSELTAITEASRALHNKREAIIRIEKQSLNALKHSVQSHKTTTSCTLGYLDTIIYGETRERTPWLKPAHTELIHIKDICHNLSSNG